MKKLTTEQVVQQFQKVHGKRYKYTNFVYESNDIKGEIFCNQHGLFKITPTHHKAGWGCPECSKLGKQRKGKKSVNTWKYEAGIIHGGKYTYYFTKVENSKELLPILCPIHGYFNMSMNMHVHKKQKCPKCANRIVGYKNRIKPNVWLERYVKLGYVYDYSKSKFGTAHTGIEIICEKHGSFYQKQYVHLRYGCPYCASERTQSIGAAKIEAVLVASSIVYEKEKRIDGCVHKRALPFDFYLTDYNTLIEFQGKQHYRPIEIFGGCEGYITQRYRDDLKRKFCHENGYKLLEIGYHQVDDIDDILRENLNV